MDAEELGINNRDMVRVKSRRGEVEVRAHVTDRSQRGVVYMSFHYDNCLTNLVTSDALDPVARTPEYKACAVHIEPLNGSPKKKARAPKKKRKKAKSK